MNASGIMYSPDETRDVGDAVDLLRRAIHLNKLMYLAGTGIFHEGGTREEGESIQVGCELIKEMLGEVKAILHANIKRKGAA